MALYGPMASRFPNKFGLVNNSLTPFASKQGRISELEL